MKDTFYRFQVFITQSLKEGNDTRKIVGGAYLRDGHRVYTLKLWMYPGIKFFLMPDLENSARMLIFTREPKKDPNIGKGKYFWNLIGTGQVDAAREVVRLEFDLFDKPIYMSIFPAKSHETPTQEITELMDAS